VVDDTALVKQGRRSVGVKRQYCGQLGKRATLMFVVNALGRDRAISARAVAERSGRVSRSAGGGAAETTVGRL
jgi:hypothetical protein